MFRPQSNIVAGCQFFSDISKFYHEKFLSLQSLTSILTSKADSGLGPIAVETLQGAQLFFGPYFKGNYYHPNQEGHIVIANLIEKKLQL